MILIKSTYKLLLTRFFDSQGQKDLNFVIIYRQRKFDEEDYEFIR